MTREKYNPEDDYNMFDWWKKAYIENYTNFTGRARRKEYWMTALANFVIILPIYIIVMISMFSNPEGLNNGEIPIAFWIGYGLIMIYGLATFIPSLALIARRLHDVGKSGWFYLIVLIPFVGAIIIFIQMVTDSQNGENKWGPNPKGFGNKDKLNEIGLSEA